ncbi:MAG: hypothetical protein VYD54_04915 [Bdellovibrionota bacterium]|nr:hypothetical protein [Bdellovibrionota bacterium]
MKLGMLFFIFLVTSCGTYKKKGNEEGKFKKRNIDEHYRSVATSKFFLREVPKWLNFSEAGKCFRSQPIKFLHLIKLRKSFGLSYVEAINFQALYNEDLRLSMSKTTQKYLPSKEEEKVFFRTLEKVKAKRFSFQRPSYKKINLIWVDNVIEGQSKKEISKLKKFLSSRKGSSGHPVFITLCKSRKELNSFLMKNELDSYNVRKLTSEMFSIFNHDNQKVPYFSLRLEALFLKNQKLNLFIPRGRIPREFGGRVKVQYLPK